jgi:transposase InsO family protein
MSFLACSRVGYSVRLARSFFSVPLNDSVQALSKHVPVRPTERFTPKPSARSTNSAERYYESQSELNRTRFNSDRGSRYTAIRYGQRLSEVGIERSVGRKGDSYDNALAESVNALCKKELIGREGPWNSVDEVTVATARWIHWYNTDRLHSWCGDVPPLEFEQSYWQRQPMVA